jgi:hypothetical protein
MIIAGCTNADRWHVVATVNLHSVAHIDAPPSIRKACRSFRTQVVPDAQLQGQSGFAGMEPDFVPLIGHGWDSSGYPPVVECDFTSHRLQDLRGLEVSQKGDTFIGAAYVDYRGDWTPADVDWND